MPGKIVLALCVIFLSSCSQSDTDFLDANGKGYSYLKLRSDWLVVNYWAIWCSPCIKEIPELNKLNMENSNIQVFGVNFDKVEGDELQKQITRMKITFPVFSQDPGPKFGVPRPEVLPTTYLFAPSENRIVKLVGPQTIESILAEID